MNASSSPAPVRVGIVGYGNLGRGAELAIAACTDLRPAGVYTRRDPARLQLQLPDTRAFPLAALAERRAEIDVLLLCGGSRSDLPQQTPELAERFCVVDSFDTHARIPAHFAAVDAAARRGGRAAVIAAGWDPGLFSVQRLLGEAVLPQGASYTFWGKGLSQGHSDALRRVPGVAGGVQYTIPSPEALAQVRSGAQPELRPQGMHRRECFVVLAEGADAAAVDVAIRTMPDYFDGWDTTVHFIDAATLAREHAAMPHGGLVIRSGRTGAAHAQRIEYRLALDSNPEFTASVLAACARAAWRLQRRGSHGAHTLLDIAPALLAAEDPAALRARLL